MIYFIEAVGGKAIKIGFSGEPSIRLRQLQTASPYPLQIMGMFDGTLWQERQIHEYLKGLPFEGEWYPRAAQVIWDMLSAARLYGISSAIEVAKKFHMRDWGKPTPVVIRPIQPLKRFSDQEKYELAQWAKSRLEAGALPREVEATLHREHGCAKSFAKHILWLTRCV